MACPCCPAGLCAGLLVFAPSVLDHFKKLGPTSQAALLTVAPLLVAAIAAPEWCTNFCSCVGNCASTRGYVAMALVVWFYAAKTLLSKMAPGEAATCAEGKQCCDAPSHVDTHNHKTATPPSAPAAKAA
ncbi:hypothetical protein AB1Y20_011969 [Prymnesium parvum]|uniref:Uncharacterized protein n=1 Tax=Prymnesium parvum TaxID=97485 RepID=A0AB34IQQ3_PRYPA|eukprot:CAMPEP_0182822398 /NCGR_PEP_ID=MMETSP0006_2-20121128/14191_1 /TAXON_ID=97485 /ORGANISM="Prymnesium parvum, Strain Texoma1" /LENGTH=128 /DNA_ID=CAMNT_0024949237 /DNA_START=16 /DNA_END=402 /DNA_ORIENTATION=-